MQQQAAVGLHHIINKLSTRLSTDNVLVVSLVVHLLTENPSGLYFVSLGFLVIGVLLNFVDDK